MKENPQLTTSTDYETGRYNMAHTTVSFLSSDNIPSYTFALHVYETRNYVRIHRAVLVFGKSHER